MTVFDMESLFAKLTDVQGEKRKLAGEINLYLLNIMIKKTILHVSDVRLNEVGVNTFLFYLFI